MSDYRTKLFKLGLIPKPYTVSMPIIPQKDKTISQIQTEEIKNLGLKVDISRAIAPQKETLDKTLTEISKVVESIQESTRNQATLNKQLASMSYLESRKFLAKEIAGVQAKRDQYKIELGKLNAELEKLTKDGAPEEKLTELKLKIEQITRLVEQYETELANLTEKFKEFEAPPEFIKPTIPPIELRVKGTTVIVSPIDLKVAQEVVNDLETLLRAPSTDKVPKFFTVGRIESAITNPLQNPLHVGTAKTGVNFEFKSGPKRYTSPIYNNTALSFGTNKLERYSTNEGAAKSISGGSYFDALFNVVITEERMGKYMKQLDAQLSPEIKPEMHIFKAS